MIEPKLRMLVPLDGSAESETILPALLPLFRRRKVRLTLLTVIPADAPAEPMETYLGRLRTSLLLDGVASESRVERGEPADEILWMAKPNRFDLIAMTTHGRTGLRRALTGSVTEQVLRHAEIPVMTCRPGTRVGDWTNLLVALDGSAAAELILPQAAALAHTAGASLRLIRVTHPVTVLMPVQGMPLQLPEPDPAPYLEGIVNRMSMDGLLALPEVRSGDVAGQITGCAGETGASLICLTTHGRTGLPRLFLGSVAERVLRTAPCPVLLTRGAAAAARATA